MNIPKQKLWAIPAACFILAAGSFLAMCWGDNFFPWLGTTILFGFIGGVSSAYIQDLP